MPQAALMYAMGCASFERLCGVQLLLRSSKRIAAWNPMP